MRRRGYDFAVKKDIYVSLEEARQEIWRRWNNIALRRRIEAFVGRVPEHLMKEPRAILNRDVATPDNEFRQFFIKARQIGLSPVVSEYLEDKFVGINSDKLSLAKMPIYMGTDRNGNSMFRYRNILDYAKYDGRKFNEIKTLWGEPLVFFHNRLLRSLYPYVEVFDNSEWLKSKGNTAYEFYPYELSLCICHGVLFEDFITNGAEKSFCEQVVNPALEKLEDMFGHKPLIVSLMSDKTSTGKVADDKYWYCYPACLENEITSFLPVIHQKSSHIFSNYKIGMVEVL